MLTFLTTIHIVACIFLVGVILLQHGKGADVGATFGGASNTVFGATGAASILSKITIGVAILFMVTSVSLAYISSSGATKSILEKDKAAKVTQKAPAAVASPVGVTVPAVPVTAPAESKPVAPAVPVAPAKK